jgi:hypothetical protein
VVGLLALVCLDLGLRLISSQFFAQLFSLFGKKGVTNPGFEPWSSGSEETDLTIALLEVSSKECIRYLLVCEPSYRHKTASSPFSPGGSKFMSGG